MSDQSSKDRTDLCTFIFNDGRHCNMLHTGNELRLCYFHEKKEMQRLLARDAGLNISRFLATNLHTACDLSAAFATLFRAGAQGYTDAKTVNSLTRLGHLIRKAHLLAKEEYLSTYEQEWPDIVEKSAVFNVDRDAAKPPQPPEAWAEPAEPAVEATQESHEQEQTQADALASEAEETHEREETAEPQQAQESGRSPSSSHAPHRSDKHQSDKDHSEEHQSDNDDSTTDDDSAEDSSTSASFNTDVPLLSRRRLLSLVNRYNTYHQAHQ